MRELAQLGRITDLYSPQVTVSCHTKYRSAAKLVQSTLQRSQTTTFLLFFFMAVITSFLRLCLFLYINQSINLFVQM